MADTSKYYKYWDDNAYISIDHHIDKSLKMILLNMGGGTEPQKVDYIERVQLSTFSKLSNAYHTLQIK